MNSTEDKKISKQSKKDIKKQGQTRLENGKKEAKYHSSKQVVILRDRKHVDKKRGMKAEQLWEGEESQERVKRK